METVNDFYLLTIFAKALMFDKVLNTLLRRKL